MSQLAGICEGYTVTGSPMNLPFTDANTVRDVIDRLKIADTARNDVEFAVATHVEPYGCTFVCSVWVYIVRLTKISSYQ
jgi:coiled-coil and C2 domain-containing protein 2A